jgi:predicted phage terminase large subunit-like protein
MLPTGGLSESEPDAFNPEKLRDVYGNLIRCANNERVDISDIVKPVGRFRRWLENNVDGYQSPKHLVNLQDLIESTSYRPVRALVSMPPRHGKTETASIGGSAWRISEDPSTRVILGSYNQKIVNRVSRRSKRLVGKNVPLRSDVRAHGEWETELGGGVKAVGVGVGIAGYGANLILIDDPIKNRFEADSLAIRERAWNWLLEDILPRCEPNASVIMIHTRWHDDDPIGRFIEQDRQSGENVWTVINYPALAESNDPLGRTEGEALWPLRFDVAHLEALREQMGHAAFETLYQGHPVARGGSMLKPSNLRWLDELPSNIIAWVRYWDLAGTEGKGDWTVGCLMGVTADRRFVICDIKRGQWSVNTRKLAMVDAAQTDGHSVGIWFERDVGINGYERTLDIARALAEFSVSVESPSGSKIFRAEPIASALEAGNLYALKGSWNFALVQEFSAFPHGRHDDIVDACSGAYAKLAARSSMMIV